MADIRIKDLTTLESASLTGDVFVIDGTTGTRKLSAFSPTFGGNATVTGTLTVNGGATVGGGSFAAASFYKSSSLGSVLSGATGSSYDLYITNPAGNYILQVPTGTRNAEFAGTLTTVGNATVGAALTVQATTASTTTSSGALVVGNGTSGGLGVGGAINAGGTITSTNGSGSGLLGMRSSSGNASYVFWSETGVADRGILGFNNGSSTLSYRSFSSSFSTGTEVFSITSAGVVSIPATTASTSTSSGALVVSGGVGVAKRIHSGEGLTTGGDNETHISFVRNGTVSIGPTSAAAPKLSISSGVVLAAATQNLAAWGDVGAQFAVSGSVLTDTQSSGTVSRCVLNSFASTNVAAAGTTTFTQAATLFVAGAPTAGTNVTITNAYAIYTAGGRINFQGLPTSSAGLQAGTLWNDGGTLKVA